MAKRNLAQVARNDNNLAIAYYRYSSSSQRDVSIEQQREQCERYAEEKGYEIVASFEDRAKSGLTTERDGYKAMLRAVETVRPTALICYKIDRLGRDMGELAQVETTLRKLGCFLETVQEPFVDPTDPNSPIMRGVQFGMAEAYSRQIAGNIQRGVDDNSRNCLFNGHKVYGYAVDETKHYVIDPETSGYVLKIFEDYAKGKRLKDIAQELNDMGLRTSRGYKWTHNSLRSILHNRAYIGEYHNGAFIIPGGMPVLITEELFERAQSRFALNKRRGSQLGKPEDAPRYWLTGKLYCGECGNPMSGMYGISGGNKRAYYYYRCTCKDCSKKPVNKEAIENAVAFVLKQLVKDSGSIASLAIDALTEYQAAHPRRTAILDSLVSKYNDVEKRTRNIVGAIERGEAYDTLLERLGDLEEQKRQLSHAIEVEKAKLALDNGEHTIRQYFERYACYDVEDSTARDLLLEYFVDRIYLYDGYLRILLSWSSTDNREIEFWEESGVPCWVWRDGSDPIKLNGSSASHLPPPSFSRPLFGAAAFLSSRGLFLTKTVMFWGNRLKIL